MGIVKGMREWENKTMNNEVEIEELDKNMRSARSIGTDNEMKYDNLARSLAMMEDELKRAEERVKSLKSWLLKMSSMLLARIRSNLRFPRRRPGRERRNIRSKSRRSTLSPLSLMTLSMKC